MYEGDQLRYGWVSGPKSTIEIGMAASEVVKAASGRFINVNTSGYGEILDDGDTAECFGHIEGPEETTSSTAGGTRYACIVGFSDIYKIPVDTGTYAITMIGDTCDVGVPSNIQGANVSASSNEQFIIRGGDATNNNWIYVSINPAKAGQTDVA